jgi:hypothetical protein
MYFTNPPAPEFSNGVGKPPPVFLKKGEKMAKKFINP